MVTSYHKSPAGVGVEFSHLLVFGYRMITVKIRSYDVKNVRTPDGFFRICLNGEPARFIDRCAGIGEILYGQFDKKNYDGIRRWLFGRSGKQPGGMDIRGVWDYIGLRCENSAAAERTLALSPCRLGRNLGVALFASAYAKEIFAQGFDFQPGAYIGAAFYCLSHESK